MGTQNCAFCKSPAHIWFDCPKKPAGWKPVKAAPVKKPKRKDTRKGDRHRPGYWAEYQRDRRARIKAEQESGK